MTALTLPEPLATYFTAAPSLDGAEAIVRCFSPQALVKDEGRSHFGHDAIRAWQRQASSQYRYTSEPFAVAPTDGGCLVTSRVTGNFPGSPVDLRYHFQLAGGLITSLEITL